MQYELRHDSADILLHFPLVTTRGRQSSYIALSEKVGATDLQLRIAEDHQVGAGVDVIPFDEGHVRSTDQLQAREVRTPHPVLGVLLHHLLPETGLLAARRAHDRV